MDAEGESDMNSSQKKALDKLWQIKITKDAICSMPGCNKQGLEGHHVFKRRYLNVRWSIENGRALCRACHAWAENNPVSYEVVIVQEIGIEAYGSLRQKARMVVKQFYGDIKEGLIS